eukprot:GHRQ01034732.1.p1 GENE.GHRQ01034732.1~~GHRQ01034732.1.p1  ORF type:complete len:104 (-),score=23.01 GHRQ01034732.1:59-370(-)
MGIRCTVTSSKYRIKSRNQLSIAQSSSRQLCLVQHAQQRWPVSRTSSVSSSRLTRILMGSVMNCCVICSTSLGSVALTSTTYTQPAAQVVEISEQTRGRRVSS